MPVSIENPGELLLRAGAATFTVASLGLAKDAQANHNPSSNIESPNAQISIGEFQTIRGTSPDGRQVELTQIGRGEGTNKIQAEIFLSNYPDYTTGKKAAKKFVEYLAIPLQPYIKYYDFWVRNPQGMENLQCTQNATCELPPFEREIDHTIAATGLVPQETFIVIKSNNSVAHGGAGAVGLFSVPPSIYHYVAVVLPDNLVSDSQKTGPGHEQGHRHGFRDGYRIQGVDINIGDGGPNCSRNPTIWGWQPTSWIGCDSDSGAYRSDETSIMRDGDVFYYGSQELRWLDKIYNGPNRKFRNLYPSLEARTRGGFSSLSVMQQAEQLPDLNLISLIYSPEGTEQLKIYISPAANKFTGLPDGPDISIYLGSLTSGNQGLRHALTETGMIIREPVMGKGPYIVLPDMTYTWTVCASGLMTPVPWNSEKWEEVEIWPGRKIHYPCQNIEMKTAKTDLTTISPVNLFGGVETDDLTPILRWRNSRTNIFYYQIRLSKDRNFNQDPQTATAAVYEELIHGGITNPLNSYTVRDNFPLEPGVMYYWQVKPRIQGDGKEIDWKDVQVVNEFKTSPTARAYSVKPDQEYFDIAHGRILVGPSKEDLDKYGAPNKSVEVGTDSSPLARVYYTENGRIFIPEAVLPRKEQLAVSLNEFQKTLNFKC